MIEVSKELKHVLRVLVDELRRGRDPWTYTLARTEREGMHRLQHDLALLTADSPIYLTDRVEPEHKPGLVKFEAPDWEYLKLATYPTNEAPCVRRLQVPGGYLYQVAYQDSTGKWHPPTFVPAATVIHPVLSKETIDSLVESARQV